LAKVELTLDELMSLLGQEMGRNTPKAKKITVSKFTMPKKPRKKTAWDRHLKSFKFRKQKRNESNSEYFGARTKAASKAYKRRKK
jgi:hypothetical protein